MATIGYMRVSTEDQKTDGQLDALKAAGVKDDAKHLYVDHGVSGAKAKRPGLDACLASLREGDVLVVAKLDRLGRSLFNLIEMFKELGEQGIDVRILDNPTLSTAGNKDAKLMLGIFGAFAEYERDLIRERTNVGLVAARARGRSGGRPVVTANDDKVKRVKKMHAIGGLAPKEIADAVGVSVATMYRYLAM